MVYACKMASAKMIGGKDYPMILPRTPDGQSSLLVLFFDHVGYYQRDEKPSSSQQLDVAYYPRPQSRIRALRSPPLSS